MPLPFEDLQGQGVFEFPSCFSDSFLVHHNHKPQEKISDFGCCYAGEPTSVLDAVRSPSPLAATSSSTLSATGDTKQPYPEHKCAHMGPEDWETVLSEPPRQEQGILKLIMGDVNDPSAGFNKGFSSYQDSNLNPAGFGVSDPGLGFGSLSGGEDAGNLVLCPVSLPQSVFQDQLVESFQDLPQILNPQVLLNQNQAHLGHNPSSLFPGQVHEQCPYQPPAKRLNSGRTGFESGFQDTFTRRIDDQSSLTEQLFKAAELIGGGGLVSAQGILARLNHQLSSPIGRPPFQRAAFYLSQALQLLLLRISSTSNPSPNTDPFSLVFKIAAYKSFSEVSPVLQFANFTCNQTLIEAFHGFDRIHIVDFDVGYGGQWASLMQELFMRKGKNPSLKITVVSSPTSHDELELRFTRENLRSFAGGLNIPFEIEITSLEFWNPVPRPSPEKEAIAVNLPISSVSDHELPQILRSVKQISPNIVVSTERGSDRTDLAFPHRIMHALQSYSSLLESLDAVNMNPDAMQKIEKFLIQPGIEKAVARRQGLLNERSLPWKALLVQMGFSPLTMSNFTEAQAECLVQRTPIRGFHVEKGPCLSLVLHWQRKELVSVSAWTLKQLPGRYH